MGEEYKRSTDIFRLQPDFGDILLYDNFESPIIQWTSEGIAAKVVELDPSNAFSGSQSIYVQTDEGSPELADYASAVRFLHPPPSLIVELLTRFNFNHSNAGSYLIALEHFVGAESFKGQVGYRASDETIIYLASDGNLTVEQTADDGLNNDPHCWHTLRMLLDLNTNKYISAQVSKYRLDISGESIYQPDTAGLESLKAFLDVYNTGAQSEYARFDTVMIKTFLGD